MINYIIIIIFLIIIFKFQRYELFMDDNPKGYLNKWYNWDNEWGILWKSNKKRKKNINKWYWY